MAPENSEKKRFDKDYAAIDPALLADYKELLMNQAKETAAHHIRIKDDMDSETVRKLTEKRAVAAQNEYDKLYYNTNASRMLKYLNGRPKELLTRDNLAFILKRQNSFLKIASAASVESKNIAEDMLGADNFRNLYGSKTNVREVSTYESNDWFTTHLDGMQSVQFDVPEGLTEREAMLVNLGEFLDKRNIQPIGEFISNSDDKGTANSASNTQETQYYAYLGQHLLVPVREKEWGHILVGKESRERTKQVLDNFAADPKKAVEDLERVYMTLSRYALNVSTWEKNRIHCILASEAYKALQNPKLAPYSTLRPEEKDIADTINGRIQVRNIKAKTLSQMSDLCFDAKLQQREDSLIKDDPAALKAFENYLADQYLCKILDFSDIHNVHYSADHSDSRMAHSKLELMLGKDLDMARKLAGEKIKKDPEYAGILNKATFDDCMDLAADYCAKAPAGYRFITADPGTMRRNLETSGFAFKAKFLEGLDKEKSIKKKDKAELLSVIDEYEKCKQALYNKESYSVKDLKEFKAPIEKIREVSTRIYDAFPADGGTLPTALATIKKASESCLRDIDTELNFQRETAPMADLIEKSVKQREAQSLIDENIEYQQQRLGLALENAVRLKAAYADFNSKKGELTPEKIQRQQKNFDSQSKALSKSIKNACASIIANKTVQAVFMSLSDGLSATDYERLADPETIKNAAKDVEKSAAFKELMKNNSLEKLQALAKKPGEPGKKEEGIEQFCKDFRLTMVRQMNRKPEKPQTVKERVV